MNDTDTGFLNFVAALTTALPALCKRSTDTGFLNFVAALTTALPALCKRSEDDPQSPRLRVIYNPDKKRAEAGEILIGLGYVLDATGQDIEQPGVVLQTRAAPTIPSALCFNTPTITISPIGVPRPTRHPGCAPGDAIHRRRLTGHLSGSSPVLGATV